MAIGIWIAVALISAWVIWSRLVLTVDLAFFLPGPSTEEEQVLMDRLGQGPGSQLLFITVHGSDKTELRNKSSHMKAALADSGLFSSVLNGQEEITRQSIPAVIWRNRYLLDEVDWSAEGLHESLLDRLADLAVLSGAEMSELIAADPSFTSVTVMERLAGSGMPSESAWINAADEAAYLIAESNAPAFDVDAQSAVVEFIRAAALESGDEQADIHGIGAYSVALKTVIRNEARYRSMLATVAIILVLLTAYRRWSLVVLATVPLLLGGLVGLAVVTLLFGTVHGITLAFGFTLFGVAVDYPLHLFSHSRAQPARNAIESIWTTLRLGAISTVIAYLAIAVSGSRGLAQLGSLSAVGVLVAMYATRSLLPLLMGRFLTVGRESPPGGQPGPAAVTAAPVYRHWIWLLALLAGVVGATLHGSIWSNDLSSLTPLSPEILKKDNELRLALGAPDIRHVISLRAESEEQALQQTELLQIRLEQARRDGLLEDARLVTSILPSRQTQQARRARIPEIAELQMRIEQALADTPFRSSAFSVFAADVAVAKESPSITSADFRDSILASFVVSHLYFDGTDWVSLATLRGLSDPERLAAWLAVEVPEATLVDFKAASESLVLTYRSRIHMVLFAAFGLIALILLWRLGLSARLWWVLGTLASAVAVTVAINAWLLAQLSIFNLIALVLVAGLGLDYALFMSRPESGAVGIQQTRHAIRVCAASTLVAFCILAVSSVPILASIGITVATGVLLNFLLAWLGSTQRTD
ncbi:MAG: MMPL family transporter [Gammaproteobacteria bacterium]|nr:MMPL family transporter [Gammaproteobacteria bacterium]